jgi:2-methylcitrate dehydratase
MANANDPDIDAVQIDAIQSAIARYASELTFGTLSKGALQTTKARVIDTTSALFGGYYTEPCRLARNLAYKVSQSDGSTIIGTRHRTTPDLAAFVNATTSRMIDANDSYHEPGSRRGHPSDTLMPVLAVGEYAHASGKELITAIALGYEIYGSLSDVVKLEGFDCTTLVCVAVAVAASKVLGLTEDQISQAISMAIIPNNALYQTRTGKLSMWKGAAAGQAGRAGVFAALLAREDFVGPHLPFVGKNGWLNYVERNTFALRPFGGNGEPFRVEKAITKVRPVGSAAIAAVLAAEKAYERLGSSEEIDRVTVEVWKIALETDGTGAEKWNPTLWEDADHSTPYVVAATLHDGTVTTRQFDAAHLADPKLRATMAKIEVVENPEFTLAYDKHPPEHRARVIVTKRNGDRVIGETGGGNDDMSAPRTESQIDEKFALFSQESLGATQTRRFLDRIWDLEEMADVATIPKYLVI